MPRAIASGNNVVVRGSCEFVDLDAIVNDKPGGLRKLGIGDDPDANDTQIKLIRYWAEATVTPW